MVEADVALRRVTKLYGEVVAVDDVSFEIRRGEFFSMLGPSGCGKSTTLRMIAGFETPSTGEVAIRGRVVNGVPPYRRATNMVFQQLALFPHLNVYDNVAFGLRVKRLGRSEIGERVRRVLDMVELPGFDRRRINQLSGGQQQRVAIARALVNEPAVLLLDEPLGALDLKLRLQMQQELKSLQHRLGTTFVYVTHDQSEALTMSDRIAVMNAGRVEQLGPPEAVYERPRTAFVASFIGDTNMVDGEVVTRDGELAAVAIGAHRFVAPADGVSAGDRVRVSLRPEKLRLAQDFPAGLNRLPVTVRDATFMGSIRRYTVATDGGPVLTVQTGVEDGASLAPGTAALVGWAPESAVIFKS